MEKILITGSTGFIGKHLVKKLKKHKIIELSNCVKKKRNHIKKNISTLSVNDIPKDITCIIHLAAMSDITLCNTNPDKCFRVNVIGTQKILEIAKKINAKVIFISSSHVYGNPEKNPISENSKLKPSSMYGTSKMLGEELCKKYSEFFKLDISVVRLFSVYGPNSPKHLVINKIITNAIESKKIELGNIFPRRDFVYIDDVINGIEKIMNETKKFQIFNIGTGKSHSIKKVHKIIEKHCKKKIPIHIQKTLLRNNEIKNVRANINKLKRVGWNSKIELNEGLKKTINWYVLQKD
jgi:nucleoside-diphosphate-sugar epimerase